MPKKEQARKRMVVEEVASEGKTTPESAKTEAPVEEKNELLGVVKEKVEELQTLTEGISESAEKSAEVQEQIVEAAEKVEPVVKSEESAQPSLPKFSSGPNPFLIIVPGIFLLGALLGGIVFYQKVVNKGGETQNVPSPATPTATGTPVPSAEVDLSKYPIKIQNGAGISGAAGVAKDLLTSAGFKVSGTGNAGSFDFTKSVIKAKSNVDPAFLTKLSSVLGKTYVLDTNQTLATASADSVQVIVGTSKAQ